MIRSFVRDQEVVVTRIRVLLADDHEDFLRQLRGEKDPEFEIVGTAENGEAAINAIGRLDPDVLVIDISMPILDGIHAAARLRVSCCCCPWLCWPSMRAPNRRTAGTLARNQVLRSCATPATPVDQVPFPAR